MWSKARNLLAHRTVKRRTDELVETAKRLSTLTYFTRWKALSIAGRAYMLCRDAATLRTRGEKPPSHTHEAHDGRLPA
ncbi:MAG TPA: hypothetical protein VFC18_22285 [Burkholderiales bacterium]|nr:hypothetical protein [Burkholderiales bacterium]